MRMVKLGDVAQIISGATPKTTESSYWGGEILWATPADLGKLHGKHISSTPRTLTQAGLASCASTVLPVGSVLLSSRAPIGHVAINTVPMATNQGFKSIIPGPELEANYLYYWLVANRATIQNFGNGATFKELSKTSTARIEVPLPPLDEQRRIAAILDKADAIRTKRRQVLAHFDDLPSSHFAETFHRFEYPKFPIGLLGRVVTGKTPPTKDPSLFEGPIQFVTPGDLEAEKRAVRSVSEKGAALSRTVGPGSTLVCCIGATIGKIGRTHERVAFNQQINAVEWGKKVDPTYGYWAMKQIRPTIVARGSSTTLPLLPKSRFSELLLPVPPIEMQLKFARAVDRIARPRDLVRQALAKDDALFASLQSRAFKGEL